MDYKVILRQNPHSYLWDKNFADWTEEDKWNLENGIGDLKKPVGKQAVKMTDKSGVETNFISVAEASRNTGLTESVIHATINGRQKAAKGNKFERIKNK